MSLWTVSRPDASERYNFDELFELDFGLWGHRKVNLTPFVLMGNMLLGVSYISKNGKVGSYEYMRIERRESGDMYFVAKPSGQSEAEFKMTEVGKRRVVFENPAHDFPQRIAYRLASDGMMKAKVEAKKNGEFKGFELTMLRTVCSE